MDSSLPAWVTRGMGTTMAARLLAIIVAVAGFAVAVSVPSAHAAITRTLAYVPNLGSDTVSVIDTSTNTVIATIPVAGRPGAVAANPAGTRVYVDNYDLASVSVIDTSSNTVIATVGVGATPVGMVVTPDGARVYVANSGSHNVSVIDTATNMVIATVDVDSGRPHGISVTPDGSRVYVTRLDTSEISVIDTATNTVIATIAVGYSPGSVAVNSAGTRAYVTAALNVPLSVIDIASNTVIATIPVPDGPGSVAINPAGTRVYVNNHLSASATVIDTASNTIIATIALSGRPSGVALNSDGTRLFVASYDTNVVSIVDTATNSVTATVGVGIDPDWLAIAEVALPDVPAPTVTGISPVTGPPGGGTTVTITGTNLTGATITFGPGNSATGVSCAPTSCTAVAPAGNIGTVHIQATTVGGTSAVSSADQYTYAATDLSVTLAANGVPGLFTGHIDYAVTITNNGPSTLTSATITAPLSTPMTPASSDCAITSGTVTCTIGALAGGASITRHFTVPIALLTVGLPYAVTATRTASAPVDLNPTNDSATRTCTVITSLIILCG